jgi:hypothetical protein
MGGYSHCTRNRQVLVHVSAPCLRICRGSARRQTKFLQGGASSCKARASCCKAGARSRKARASCCKAGARSRKARASCCKARARSRKARARAQLTRSRREAPEERNPTSRSGSLLFLLPAELVPPQQTQSLKSLFWSVCDDVRKGSLIVLPH